MTSVSPVSPSRIAIAIHGGAHTVSTIAVRLRVDPHNAELRDTIAGMVASGFLIHFADGNQLHLADPSAYDNVVVSSITPNVPADARGEDAMHRLDIYDGEAGDGKLRESITLPGDRDAAAPAAYNLMAERGCPSEVGLLWLWWRNPVGDGGGVWDFEGQIHGGPKDQVNCQCHDRNTGRRIKGVVGVTPGDTLDVEKLIRETYWRMLREGKHRYGKPGVPCEYDTAIVELHDLRAELPADLPKETVDTALKRLMSNANVHLQPGPLGRRELPNYPGQTTAAPTAEQEDAKIRVGGSDAHFIMIERDPRMSDVLQIVRSADADRATSAVAAVPDDQLPWLAEQMGVDLGGANTPEQRRLLIVGQSAENHRAWMAEARSSHDDAMLLHRADNEPDWVATWTPTDWAAARAAGRRMLARHTSGEQGWDSPHYGERARRWMDDPNAPAGVSPTGNGGGR